MRQFATVLALVCMAHIFSFAQQSTAPAGTQAGTPPSASRKPATKPPTRRNQPTPDEGSVAAGTYSEQYFNLTCTIPQGWVVRTAEMRKGLAADANSILLLSTFAKEAPDANQVNPSLTITAESLAANPQLQTAEDYFDNLSDIVTSKGFSVVNEPAQIDVGGVTFLRGDFQKQEGTLIYQASMVAFRKGYILSVTAISGNEEQLTPLLNRVRIIAPPTLGKP